VSTELWSGGEVRAVVRHAEDVEDPVTLTLDGEALAVTRVDDTTFAAQLPMHTGELALRAEREGLDPLEATVTLHGYVSGERGLTIEGHVVTLPGPGGRVLGVAPTGLQEVLLASGQVVREWGTDVASLLCGPGVQYGLEADHYVVRGRNAEGTCLQPTIIRVTNDLEQAATIDWLDGFSWSAIPVGGKIFHRTYHDLPAATVECDGAWGACQLTEGGFTNRNHSLFGSRVDRRSDRVVTLASRAKLYDRATGVVVAELPAEGPHPGWTTTLDAAFSADAERFFTVTESWQGPAWGSLLERDVSTGAITDSAGFEGEAAIAVAEDEATGVVLVATKGSGGVGLRVFARSPLREVGYLPITDPEIAADIVPSGVVLGRGHHRLLIDALARRAYLVGTNYIAFSPRRPAVIARWSLPAE
jgi:hypothetical protein